MRSAFAFKSHYQKAKQFYSRYERWLMPVTLAVGFLADYVTFVNIQVGTALVILYVYWFIAALAIAFIHAYDAGRLSERLRYLRLLAPLVIQFTFGGLLSNSFIFYWFSGSIWVSWPFILAFVLLMVLNDALRHYFLRPLVQLAVFFFATFSAVSVTLPFALNSLNSWLFVLAGVITFTVLCLFVWALSAFSPYVKQKWRGLLVSFLAILAAVNIFYFTNLIPPVPLAIRELGVYHNVHRSGGQYVLKAEPETFWQRLLPGRTVHLKQGQRVYVYTAVYSPKELNTVIVHVWRYYDEQKGEWVTKDKLAFDLIGGRQEGFRGYSWKANLPAGDWRVYVETERGQTLGRVQFKLENADAQVDLVETLR